MLVFIDESGDTGNKFSHGSSRYFVIVAVIFENHEEALECDQAIEHLKIEFKWSKSMEFKFNQLNKRSRLTFLKSITKYNFFYLCTILDKPKLVGSTLLSQKTSLLKYTFSLIFESLKPYLKEAVIVIDGSGSRQFKTQLQSYFKHQAPGLIKKVKLQSSHSNHLLQLADMVAGTIHRSLTDKTDNQKYLTVIKPLELQLRIWPPLP